MIKITKMTINNTSLKGMVTNKQYCHGIKEDGELILKDHPPDEDVNMVHNGVIEFNIVNMDKSEKPECKAILKWK